MFSHFLLASIISLRDIISFGWKAKIDIFAFRPHFHYNKKAGWKKIPLFKNWLKF